jgi:iduronate 2-sulfatase
LIPRLLLFVPALALAQGSASVQVPAVPAPVSQPAPPTTGRLNVLFIVADDLYWKIGLYGHPEVRTPNLERLAARGRRFDAAYAQYPICNPSRTSFMTGWRPERTHVWGNADAPRASLRGAVPLQEHFKANGYTTARLGKIYHGPFETQFQWDLAEDAPDRPEATVADDEAFEARVIPTTRDDAAEPDGHTARRAAQVIEQHRDRPFFVAVGFVRPHGPWMAPRRYFDLYPPSGVTLPRQVASDLDDVPRVALKRGAEPSIPAAKRQEALAAYYACVTFMDAQVGVLLDTLDRLSLWDRTVVVFLSDHGIQRGEHGLWRKNVLFEESARVPLVVAAPQVARPGTPSPALVELVDVYPTVAALAGVPVPSGLDGVSLRPLLDDPRARVKDVAFTVSSRGRRLGRSVRTARYRYTWWRPDAAELYDHENDPGEHRNLARDPRQRETVARLKRLIEEGAGERLTETETTPQPVPVDRGHRGRHRDTEGRRGSGT